MLGARVVDHDVGVATGRDGALARVQAEHAGRSGAGQLDPPTAADASLNHRLVQQVDPVLHAWDAVGDLREIAASEFLLILEAERAVVG